MKTFLVIEIMMLLQLVPQGVLLCDMPLLPLLLSVLVTSLIAFCMYVKLTKRRPMYLSFSSSYLQCSRCGRPLDSILLCSVHDSGYILVCSI